MATINGLYVFVESEDYSYNVEIPEHTVETGVDISDHVQRKATTLSIVGEIVGDSSELIKTSLRTMQQKGVLCTFVGRNTLTNCLIVDFTPTYNVDIWGGCGFSMTLKEVRTASSSYKTTTTKDTKKTGTQQVVKRSKEKYVYHTVKKGDCVWALVAGPNAPYKKYGLTCEEVMELCQSAFSRKGDFRTLQIGARIIVGKR